MIHFNICILIILSMMNGNLQNVLQGMLHHTLLIPSFVFSNQACMSLYVETHSVGGGLKYGPIPAVKLNISQNSISLQMNSATAT